jgi:hypothetical protein
VRIDRKLESLDGSVVFAAASYDAISRGAQCRRRRGPKSHRRQDSTAHRETVFQQLLSDNPQDANRRFPTGAISALSEASRSSQLFLTQFSKDILIPDDKELLFRQNRLEEIPSQLLAELPNGIYSWIDFPVQGFLRVTEFCYDGVEIHLADNHHVHVTVFALRSLATLRSLFSEGMATKPRSKEGMASCAR